MAKPKTLIPQLTENAIPAVEKDLTIRLLNRELTFGPFVNELGLNILKAGDKVPDSNGVPRIFLFKDGKVSSLEENQIEVGSREFWKAAAMGQLFGYPAGERHPVQIQLRHKSGITPDLTFSDPLDPEKLPQVDLPKAPRKPKWYHRVFSFGGNRRLCREYDHYMAEKERQANLAASCAAAVREAYGDKRIGISLNAEKREAEYIQAELAEGRLKKALREQLNLIKRDQGNLQQAIDTTVSVYGPVPKQLPGLKGKVYTQEQFDLLKPIDLKGAQVGGKTVTDREFGALALFAGNDPEIAIEAQKVAGDPEPVIDAFAEDGYSREEAGQIMSDSGREMYSRTLMIQRPSTGTYFAPAVQPARQKAKEALDAYQRGDKGPLADILARMVGSIGREAINSMGLDDSFYAQNELACDMLDMMERDPELKETVHQKYEQSEQAFQQRHPQFLKPPSFTEQMDTIRQVQEMKRLQMKSMEAKTALLNARLNGDEDKLSEEVKRGYIKDVLKYNLVRLMYKADVNMAESTSAPNPRNGTYKAFYEHANTLPGKEMGVGSRSGASSAPLAPNVIMQGGLGARAMPKPDIMSQIASPKMMAELDESLDKLIEKEGLGKLGVDELSDKLAQQHPDGNEYTNESLMDKLIDANIQPKEKPAGTEVPEQELQKAQDGQAAEMPAKQQAGQKIPQ